MSLKASVEAFHENATQFLKTLEQNQASSEPERTRLAGSVDRRAHATQTSASCCHNRIENWDLFDESYPEIARASIDLATFFLQIYREQPKDIHQKKRDWTKLYTPWIEELRSRLATLSLALATCSTADQDRRNASQPPRTEESDVRIVRDRETEDRDKFLYDKCFEGIKYSVIINELKNYRSWSSIGTPQGIKDAANSYADRHKRQRIPKRQAGRKSKGST